MGELEAAVSGSLSDISDVRDAGAVELALTYARAIDEGQDVSRIGPALLNALAQLGLTPAARASLVKGGQRVDATANPLDELRARREARTG